MRKKIAAGVLFLIMVVSFVILAMRIIPVIKKNQEIEDQWKISSEKSIRSFREYKDKIPMEEMDLEKLLEDVEVVPMNAFEDEKGYTLTLTEDLHYYKSKEGKRVLEKTIPSGTEIQIFSAVHEKPRITGYGMNSLPTYERGWRYVRSFLTKEEAEGIEIKEEAEDTYYFIKTNELEKVVDAFVQKYVKATDIPEGKNKDEYRKEIYNQQMYGVDSTMLTYGIYKSPNLTEPLINTGNIILLILGVLTGIGGIVVTGKATKK